MFTTHYVKPHAEILTISNFFHLKPKARCIC